MKNIFEKSITDEVINRLNQLDSKSQPKWGKMNVAQMLAHCSVTYEMIYEDKHAKPGKFAQFMLKLFVKKTVVGEKPYKKNSRTAPAFLITDQRIFNNERDRLVKYLIQTQELGEDHFDNKMSHSFGVLTKKEWNNMFYKHIDHHLQQFGV